MKMDVALEAIGKADKKEEQKFSVNFQDEKVGEIWWEKAKGRFAGQVEFNGKTSKLSYRNSTYGLVRAFAGWLKRAAGSGPVAEKPKARVKVPPTKKPTAKPTAAIPKSKTPKPKPAAKPAPKKAPKAPVKAAETPAPAEPAASEAGTQNGQEPGSI